MAIFHYSSGVGRWMNPDYVTFVSVLMTAQRSFTQQNKVIVALTVWYCKTLNTAKLQWLKPVWNHEKMFQTRVLRANDCLSLRKVRRHTKDIFLFFFNMKVHVCCVF